MSICNQYRLHNSSKKDARRMAYMEWKEKYCKLTYILCYMQTIT